MEHARKWRGRKKPHTFEREKRNGEIKNGNQAGVQLRGKGKPHILIFSSWKKYSPTRGKKITEMKKTRGEPKMQKTEPEWYFGIH